MQSGRWLQWVIDSYKKGNVEKMISLRGPKFNYVIGLIALVMFIAGIYITFFQSRGFETTTGTVVDVVEDNTNDDPTYWQIVEYTVDDVSYTERAMEGSNSDSTGKTVTVLYDPKNPAKFHIKSFMSIYMMIVSGIILAIVIFSTITDKKNIKKNEALRKTSGHNGYAPHVEGEERELYFLTDLGTAKYGHRIEDKNRKVLYEAKMTKFTLTSAFQFDFIDHEHGKTTPHLVGHEEEVEWGSLLVDNHSTFEFDGVDVWKHLKNNGISVDTSYTAGKATLVGMKYRILRDGMEIAHAEMTSQYPHEDDEARHKIAKALPVKGFYRVWTKEQNLDLLFVTLLAFARCSAADDQGGTNRAVIGTIKNIAEHNRK